VLRNGAEIFPAMLEAIRAANDSVRLLTFIYWSGEVAKEFAHALSERARVGVTVQVLVDAVGSFAMPKAIEEELLDAGAEFRRFRPVSAWRLSRTNFRTHRKVLVCDGAVGFTGGVGIAEEWEGDARNPDEWRETHFRVSGPAVSGLEATFWGNWLEAGGELDTKVSQPSTGGAAAGNVALQVVPSHGRLPRSEMMTVSELILQTAQRSLQIQTAYFVPDTRMRKQLCETAQRGVKIEVLLPGEHSDHRLCNFAGRSEYTELLEAGVQLCRYQKTMLHTKVAIVDHEYAVVGSPNFNQRSLRRDDEIALVLFDQALAETLAQHFQEDMQHAEEFDIERWPKRGLGHRIRERLAALIRREL